MVSVRKTSCPLRFVIVGGSIAGLATAHALSRSGHHVLVLEQSDGTFVGPGCVRAPPNASRIFEAWGLSAELQQAGLVSTGLAFRDCETLAVIGGLRYTPQIVEDFGAPFHYVRYADVYHRLRHLAVHSGAHLRFNARVTAVDPDTPSATLETGEVIRADIVIGADGAGSFVRELIQEHETSSKPSEFSCFSFDVPLEEMRKDPELATFANTPEWTIFTGNNCIMQGCPLPPQGIYHLFIKAHYSGPVRLHETWHESVPPEKAGLESLPLGPAVHKLLRLTRAVVPTLDVVREPPESWLHDNGKVLIVGAAAHPIAVAGHHHVAACLEDAHLLASLLSHLTSPRQLPTLLSAYDDLRAPRSHELVRSERITTRFGTLPPGPARDQVRAGQRMAAEDWDEVGGALLERAWGGFMQPLKYDAEEVAEEWWMLWGKAVEAQGRDVPGKAREGEGEDAPGRIAVPVEVASQSVTVH